MLEVILALVVKLIEIAAKVAAGKMTEDEARAECAVVGVSITETDSDAELAEHDKLMGGNP
jgi:hypothetical protein